MIAHPGPGQVGDRAQVQGEPADQWQGRGAADERQPDERGLDRYGTGADLLDGRGAGARVAWRSAIFAGKLFGADVEQRAAGYVCGKGHAKLPLW